MNSSQDTLTPRRSQRLRKPSNETPEKEVKETKVKGPRMWAKSRKTQRLLNRTDLGGSSLADQSNASAVAVTESKKSAKATKVDTLEPAIVKEEQVSLPDLAEEAEAVENVALKPEIIAEAAQEVKLEIIGEEAAYEVALKTVEIVAEAVQELAPKTTEIICPNIEKLQSILDIEGKQEQISMEEKETAEAIDAATELEKLDDATTPDPQEKQHESAQSNDTYDDDQSTVVDAEKSSEKLKEAEKEKPATSKEQVESSVPQALALVVKSECEIKAFVPTFHHDNSNLMDESIISVPDTPPPATARDSTFSPVVDKSLHDSRPVIDPPKTPTALYTGNSLRTSTPYARKHIETSFIEPVKEPKVNHLERSILKSSRRKRSFSVTDTESFAQKKVMFISPKIMDIDAIDEKMMASFIEEKENSAMKTAAGSARRKRSHSTGGTPGTHEKPKPVARKMPNFKAIHELQFKKMESIAEHAVRKAERAKKLTTPVKDSIGQEKSQPKNQVVSKIPTRRVLTSSSTIDQNMPRGRKLKRSLSVNHDEPPTKKVQISSTSSVAASSSNTRKIAVVTGLQRSNSENAKPAWSSQSSACAIAQVIKKQAATSTGDTSKYRGKVEERREKNMSLYKSKPSTTTVASNNRAKAGEILKGVRLNRRFELQMQHRELQDREFQDREN